MKKKSKPLTNKNGEVRTLTPADIKRGRPAIEVFPKLVAAYEKGDLRYRGERGPQIAPKKTPTNIRLSPDVLAFFKSKGQGWQTRIDRALQAFVDAAR